MSQSLAKILIHVIFSTKSRTPWIQPEIQQKLHDYMAGIARVHKADVYEVGGVEDHVHLLLGLPRALSTADLVQEIKMGSSKWIKREGPSFVDFAWQGGYGAFSIGHSHIDVVRKYIQTQREHHKTVSFQEEYLAILRKYAITFDEKYLWD